MDRSGEHPILLRILRNTRISSLPPEQNPEYKLREQANDKEYDEGDLAVRNRYGDYVAQGCQHEQKENMLEYSCHFATPLRIGGAPPTATALPE